MKKLSILLVVALVASAASANVLDGNTRLYWRDNDGAPNDSRVTAAPGDVVFIQLSINSTSNQGNGKDYFLNASFDAADGVIDTTAAPGGFVTVDTDMYMTFRDYQNPGGSSWNYTGVEIISYGAGFDTLNIDFNGPTNLYPYSNPNGGDTGGAPIGETGTAGALTASEYFTTLGSGGVVAGFWVPIASDATPGSTTFFDVVVTSSGAWGGAGWGGALTEAGTGAYDDATYAMQISIVPEPATMSLLAIGGIAALIRRKK
jgi:hypothetical protein